MTILQTSSVVTCNITAASNSDTDIQTAINAATNGQTVCVPAGGGTVTWTTGISIPNTKGVTVRVIGGTNTPKGSASFPLVVTCNTTAATITCGQNKALSRLSGFKFQGSTTGVPYIKVTGNGTGVGGYGAFRIDNCYFDAIKFDYGIQSYATGNLPMYGLIDNCTFHDIWATGAGGIYGVQVWCDDHAADGCWGENGWTDPFTWGSQNFVFLEDNLWESLTASHWIRHCVSAELGGRYVARYNSFNITIDQSGALTDLLDCHGFCLCASNGAGGRGGEIYQNTFSGSMQGRVGNIRGGEWLMYDNVQSGTASAFPASLQEYRAGAAGDQAQCSSFAACSPCTTEFPNYFGAVGANTTHYPLSQQIGDDGYGASAPSYFWNNTIASVNQDPSVDAAGVQSSYIQINRDYFTSTSKPGALAGYTPFTYPHPLRTA